MRDSSDGSPAKVEFVYPSATLAVSVTGNDCALKCAHCGGHYLKGMVPAARALQTVERAKGRYMSCLVSGGCDRRGAVPVLNDESLLRGLKRAGLRLNFHTGIVNEDTAAGVAEWADCVSLDLVLDGETIREVFGPTLRPEDFAASYESLARRARVVPHVCLGLRGGSLRGERLVLEYLACDRRRPEHLVLIVFTPTEGTAFEHRMPPDPREVGEYVALAGEMLPGTKLTLGCMRPRGRYREQVDMQCLEAGIDGIVNPSPAAERRAREGGWRVLTKRECCAL
ncbi:MAG: radical SAM protein [Firmicutes bacterium]|nr:radical SAM protein [Bacillota bacterium]